MADDSRGDIAILGYGCRLPGANDIDAFDALLRKGGCAVSHVPDDRWSAAGHVHPDRQMAGTTYTNAAGVLDDPFGFDAAFFGISAREAMQMDPQQRLLLEVAWEAIDYAGLTPERLSGPRTGVYVGASSLEHSNIHLGDPTLPDSRFMTGNALSILANRVSHALDLHGPSIVIDTACSSALFAFHAACTAVDAGEIDVAIVGGVNLLLSPQPYIGFSRAAMLSPSGLCRAFDAQADGYVRAEGAVAFVIARHDWAKAGGDRVLGHVVGSGINSNGSVSALSVPNAQRQAELITAVYQRAGVAPDRLAFIEAHGTGTAVGDPIEAAALGAALGSRRAAPLPIGSVKSNVGHLEPAAGLVGLLKAQRALEMGVFPATLHVETPNPAIDFDGLNLSLARDAMALRDAAEPWVAGVNSFGFGGANAHVAISQTTDCAPSAAPPGKAPLILTAASAAALKTMAGRWADRLADSDPAQAATLVNAAAHRRGWREHRLVTMPGADGAAALRDFLADRQGDWVSATAPAGRARPTAFVFSGNGAQWPGMGRDAYARDPDFQRAFEATSQAVQAAGGPDLAEALFAADLSEKLDEALYAQPLLLAIQIALVAALDARGIRPDFVIGHSVGEVAAAWATGALDLQQVARLSVARARCQTPLKGTGTMAAVLADAAQTEGLISLLGLEHTGIAADNSPRGTTVSGPVDEVARLIEAGRERRIAMRKLQIAYPFHGPMMERIEQPLRAALADLAPRRGNLPFFSTTLGAAVAGEALDAEYWWLNARQHVRFRETALLLAQRGAEVFVEIGPQPMLQNYLADTLKSAGLAMRYVPGLRRQGEESGLPARVAAHVAAAGGSVDRAALFGPPVPQAEPLPAYGWDHQPFRLGATGAGLNIVRRPVAHPLLGWQASEGDRSWRRTLSAAEPDWLTDHALDGHVVVPGAVFAELALAAGAKALGSEALHLHDLDILRPLTLGGGTVDLRTHVEPGTGAVTIESRPGGTTEAFTRHATATIRLAARTNTAAPLPAPPPTSAADPGLYAQLSGLGLDYGPGFRRVGPVAHTDRTARAGFVPSIIAPAKGWLIDPTALDASFHLLAPVLRAAGSEALDGHKLVPVRIGNLTLEQPGVTIAGAQLTLTQLGQRSAAATISLLAADGTLVARAEDVRFAAMRLPRRSGAASPVWVETLVPRRLDPTEPSLRPAHWADPASRLVALGLASAATPPLSATALVLDAACRRVTWEAARRIAPDGGIRFQARRALPPALAASLMLGLSALEADGHYDSDADAVAATASVPDLHALTDALLATEPQSVHRLLPVLRLEAALREATVLPHQAGLRDHDVWAPLDNAAMDLCTGLSEGQPLDVLVIGSGAATLCHRLLANGASRVEAVATVSEAARLAGPWDLILVGDLAAVDSAGRAMLGDALAVNGLLMALWRTALLPDAMLHLAEGGRAMPPVAPLSGWDSADATYRVQTLDLPGQEGGVVTVERRSAMATPVREPVASAVILSDQGGQGLAAAVALQEALSAAGRQAWIVNETAEIAVGSDVVVLRGALDRRDAPLPAIRARIEDLRAVAACAGEATVWLASLGRNSTRLADEALSRSLRVLANERPQLDLRMVHARADTPTDAARLLARAMMASDGVATGAEREMTVTPQTALVPRLEAMAQIQRVETGSDDPAPAQVLQFGAGGGLEALVWAPQQRKAPGPGEIEIEVAATGLNFRDVMWTIGLLPEEALEEGFSGSGLGMECTGTVVAAGDGARWPVGTRVMGFAGGAFATHVTIADSAAHALPDSIGFTEAASLPVAAATAHHALVELANIAAGETVLVHGGAGGVGLAALQIALARGARVIATAGSAEKRALLRLLGASAVFDSRSLDFADGVMTQTGGRGVDVALNSLAGEAMEATLRCMAPFGRFVELGKRDLYGNTRIGLRPLRRNIAYFAVDLDAMLAARPAIAGRMLEALASGLADGSVTPLPHHVFDASQTEEAFRLMQRAAHIGKIVLTPPPMKAAAPRAVPLVRPDAAWLVTGGTSGLGLAFAARLARRGAGKLWLVSRSGQIAAADAAIVAAMKANGTTVEILACDVTDAAAMGQLFDTIRADATPLRGVAHAAALLDDGAFDTLDGERLARATAPKIVGGALLDTLTAGLPLEHFVLFSSMAVTVGNPGQTAYVAGNAALEGLASTRRAEGKPAVAVRWPPIADLGMLARDADALAMLERRGAGPMVAERALDMFESVMAQTETPTVFGFGAPRWGALSSDLPYLRSSMFERVAHDEQEGLGSATAHDVTAEIAALNDADALERLRRYLRLEAARILRHEEHEIDPTRALQELGFDSLMAMELKLALEERYGLNPAGTAGTDGATLNSIAAELLAESRRDSVGEAQAATGSAAHLARHVAQDQVATVSARLSAREDRA